MSYGAHCKHCGQQGSVHENINVVEGGADEILDGYKYQVAMCPGFQYHPRDYDWVISEYRGDPIRDFPQHLIERARKLDEKEGVVRDYIEEGERMAKERSAWGYFMALSFAKTEEKQIKTLDEEITRARTSEERQAAIEAKKQFCKRIQGSPMYVG